jgi:arylsulfatase A-like enzyme
VDSNSKKYNQNITVLEWLHQQEAYKWKVAAFCSWDVFPYIINDVRSGIPVNASAAYAGKELTEKEKLLNDLQDEVPVLFGDMRLDVFTHHYALEYMEKYHPRVVYIAYGETDDFAHAGKYDNYLYSAHQTDKWIGEVWDFLQSDEQYRDKTTVFITTDHGRGNSPKEEWKSHGKIFKGSPGIWFAVMGPDTPATGEVMQSGQLYQNQVAETIARFLGLDYTSPNETGECINSMFFDQPANDKR